MSSATALTSSMLVTGCLVLAGAGPLVAHGQTEPNGQDQNSGSRGTIVVDPLKLSYGGLALFDSNGNFAVVAPGVHMNSFANNAGNSWRPPGPPSPPNPSLIPSADLQALEAELMLTRAANCLTMAESAPCTAPTVPSGAFDVVSTEVDLNWLAHQEVQAALRDVPLPGIVLQANPPNGLAEMDSWFWVDRRTYEGQVFREPVHIPVPWTLDWDTLVHHHDTSSAPCADDPGQQCTTSHDWDETVHHHEDHLDAVDVTVTLSPAQYTWDFGDDEGGPWRATSHASFTDGAGLGMPYTDPFHASTVVHKYSQSSLDVFDSGGFAVRLTATWGASAHVQASRDGGVVQDETLSLPPRIGQYEQRYQVRESQPVLRSASSR